MNPYVIGTICVLTYLAYCLGVITGHVNIAYSQESPLDARTDDDQRTEIPSSDLVFTEPAYDQEDVDQAIEKIHRFATAKMGYYGGGPAAPVIVAPRVVRFGTDEQRDQIREAVIPNLEELAATLARHPTIDGSINPLSRNDTLSLATVYKNLQVTDPSQRENLLTAISMNNATQSAAPHIVHLERVGPDPQNRFAILLSDLIREKNSQHEEESDQSSRLERTLAELEELPADTRNDPEARQIAAVNLKTILGPYFLVRFEPSIDRWAKPSGMQTVEETEKQLVNVLNGRLERLKWRLKLGKRDLDTLPDYLAQIPTEYVGEVLTQWTLENAASKTNPWHFDTASKLVLFLANPELPEDQQSRWIQTVVRSWPVHGTETDWRIPIDLLGQVGTPAAGRGILTLMRNHPRSMTEFFSDYKYSLESILEAHPEFASELRTELSNLQKTHPFEPFSYLAIDLGLEPEPYSLETVIAEALRQLSESKTEEEAKGLFNFLVQKIGHVMSSENLETFARFYSNPYFKVAFDQAVSDRPEKFVESVESAVARPTSTSAEAGR